MRKTLLDHPAKAAVSLILTVLIAVILMRHAHLVPPRRSGWEAGVAINPPEAAATMGLTLQPLKKSLARPAN